MKTPKCNYMQRLVNIPGRVTGKILIAGTLPIAFLSACQESSPDSSERPNIVWIIANDYSPDAGCYGNEIVQTPNIDELAKQGKKYVHAFVTNPVCSPSRSAFYTGMYQTTIRAHQHRTYNKPDLPDSVEAITRYFQEAGYFTSNGKGIKIVHRAKRISIFSMMRCSMEPIGLRENQVNPFLPLCRLIIPIVLLKAIQVILLIPIV